MQMRMGVMKHVDGTRRYESHNTDLLFVMLLQLVWARTHAVGCGMTRCAELEGSEDANENALFLVCNYGPG